MSKLKKELKEMSVDQLIEKVGLLKQELFGLKFNRCDAYKNYSYIGILKKDIARALTYLNQKSYNNIKVSNGF